MNNFALGRELREELLMGHHVYQRSIDKVNFELVKKITFFINLPFCLFHPVETLDF